MLTHIASVVKETRTPCGTQWSECCILGTGGGGKGNPETIMWSVEGLGNSQECPPKLFKCSQSGSEATAVSLKYLGQVLIGVFGKQSALHSALNSTCLYLYSIV